MNDIITKTTELTKKLPTISASPSPVSSSPSPSLSAASTTTTGVSESGFNWWSALKYSAIILILAVLGLNLFTYLGSKGNKIFIRKWGMSINFFEKNFLKSGHDANKNMIINKFDGPLENPNKDYFFFINLLKFKLYKLYLNIINYN